LGAGSSFRRAALLRLLRLGAGSGFRRGALLRLLTCGRFRRRSLLLGSGLGRGTLLRLLPGSGFGRGPLLRLLTENFLLLSALLHELCCAPDRLAACGEGAAGFGGGAVSRADRCVPDGCEPAAAGVAAFPG
jgi:hypothetical protein